MSHNSLDQELEFFLSFLKNSIDGQENYSLIVNSLLNEAKALALGKSIYELDKTALNLKILIDRFAHDWLLKVNIDSLNKEDLIELQQIIEDNKIFAIA